jgi:hypothetical protein
MRFLSYAYARAGKETEARSLFSCYMEQSRNTYVSWYDIALFYAGLNESQQCIACLEKARESNDVKRANIAGKNCLAIHAGMHGLTDFWRTSGYAPVWSRRQRTESTRRTKDG